jgi:hypothetical protein
MEASAQTVVSPQRFSKRNTLHFVCCGRTAVAGGNETQENIPACANERKNNRTASNLRVLFQASAHIMDLDS